MKVLLDTHILLWAAADSASLSEKAREILLSGSAELHFSAASIWEVAIKMGLGRPDFAVDPRQLRRGLLSNGYLELPITGEHAVEVSELEDLHKDPFDRILIAQAKVEGMQLVTADKLVAKYSGNILMV
ncbi:MAG: PIN domain nuclease [Betaproteobacteria bacterium HGW-Betaproteobacteria-15]|jgi:PIN domain nuclease of toxin-antitoxin system|nr:MAG: PIN domain nuclease [Betaproteobacteria bacterium HGW-Betaproteobacteria-15]